MGCTIVLIDFLIVTKRQTIVHMQKIREVSKVLDEASLHLRADKCEVSCTKIERLGYEL